MTNPAKLASDNFSRTRGGDPDFKLPGAALMGFSPHARGVIPPLPGSKYTTSTFPRTARG